MAYAPQRRRVLDTGVGANLIEALTGRLAAGIDEKRKQKDQLALQQQQAQMEEESAIRKLQLEQEFKGSQGLKEIFAKAAAEAEAKQAFPEPLSPEDLTKQRILDLAGQEGRVPQPEGGYNRLEESRGIPGMVESAARGRELSVLQRLMGKSSGSPVNVAYFDPATGQTFDSPGGQNRPAGTRVMPLRTSPEEAEALARSRATGKIETETAPGMVDRRAGAAAAIKSAEGAANPPLEKTTSVISAESALRSIGELRSIISKSGPEALLQKGIPGTESGRTLERILKNLELEIVTARGGKALTPSERELIRNVFPDRLDALDAMFRDDPQVIEDKLSELEMKANSLIQRVPIESERGSSSPAAEAAKARLRAKYGQR